MLLFFLISTLKLLIKPSTYWLEKRLQFILYQSLFYLSINSYFQHYIVLVIYHPFIENEFKVTKSN